jgi:hypothetical protein
MVKACHLVDLAEPVDLAVAGSVGWRPAGLASA